MPYYVTNLPTPKGLGVQSSSGVMSYHSLCSIHSCTASAGGFNLFFSKTSLETGCGVQQYRTHECAWERVFDVQRYLAHEMSFRTAAVCPREKDSLRLIIGSRSIVSLTLALAYLSYLLASGREREGERHDHQTVTKGLTSSSKFSGSCVPTLQTLPIS